MSCPSRGPSPSRRSPNGSSFLWLASPREVVGEDLALEALDHQRATPLIGQEAPGEGAEAIEVSHA